MAELEHFSYGATTPLVAFVVSMLGSLLGLICTSRARRASNIRRRINWLLLAAWAIGLTGVWTMHFIAMIGFSIPGRVIRYDVATTIGSAAVAVAVVALGLLVVGLGTPRPWKVVVGGVFTGVGVAAMHYLGMAGMRFDGTIDYDPGLFGASIVIAIVAATAALWFTTVARRPSAILASAVAMGIAVAGMHYTGMAAMHVTLHDPSFTVRGTPVLGLLLPLGVVVVLLVIGLGFAIMAAPTEEDDAAAEYLQRLQAAREAGPAAPSRGTSRRPPAAAAAMVSRPDPKTGPHG